MICQWQWCSQVLSKGANPRERSDRAGGGCVPPHTAGRFLKIRVSKRHFLQIRCHYLGVVYVVAYRPIPYSFSYSPINRGGHGPLVPPLSYASGRSCTRGSQSIEIVGKSIVPWRLKWQILKIILSQKMAIETPLKHWWSCCQLAGKRIFYGLMHTTISFCPLLLRK